MRRVLALVTVVSLFAPGTATFAAGASQSVAQSSGSISGRATSSNGRVMSNTSVRLRNLANGQIAGTTTTSAVGQFSFGSLPAGDYMIEVVNAAGEIVGTSAMMSLASGAVVSGVTVSASAAGAAAAAGAGGSFFGTTAGLVSIAAAGAAVAAVTIAANQTTASPSK